MRSLHNEIMNIRVPDGIEDQPPGNRIIYKTGHRDARHAAAELANKYDDNHERLVQALEDMLSEFNENMAGIVHDEMSVIAKARSALRDARYGRLQKARTLPASLEAEKGGEL